MGIPQALLHTARLDENGNILLHDPGEAGANGNANANGAGDGPQIEEVGDVDDVHSLGTPGDGEAAEAARARGESN